MTSRDFCYWLQGYFELDEKRVYQDPNKESELQKLNSLQIQTIRNHLNMVFKHEIDPSHGNADHVKALSDLHKRHLAGAPTGHVGTILSSDPFETVLNC